MNARSGEKIRTVIIQAVSFCYEVGFVDNRNMLYILDWNPPKFVDINKYI